MRDEPAEERQIRRDALHLGFGERRPELRERVPPRLAVGDELRDQWVVAKADLVPLLDARIDAHARRQREACDAPGLRQERPRVLRVQPHLHRVAAWLVPGCDKGLAAGDADLLLDEIDAGHELRHRVLDLDAAVQLEEIEVAS